MTSTARSCQPKSIVKLALLGLGLLLLQPAMARQDDREKPANISAKSFDATQQGNGVIIYKDHVLLTQGTLKATASLAKAYLDADNSITRVVLTGSPAHIEQLDDKGNLMQGAADTIDYDNVKQIAVLSGNASVKQKGRGEAEGDKLTYNTQTSQMTGESNGDGLVHMTFQPKPKPAAATPKPATVPAATTPAASAPTPAHSSSTPPGQP
ncbi:MAG: lipopolysaccharide transport periplasmic protein LptA [Rhodanobacter sp.]